MTKKYLNNLINLLEGISKDKQIIIYDIKDSSSIEDKWICRLCVYRTGVILDSPTLWVSTCDMIDYIIRVRRDFNDLYKSFNDETLGALEVNIPVNKLPNDLVPYTIIEDLGGLDGLVIYAGEYLNIIKAVQSGELTLEDLRNLAKVTMHGYYPKFAELIYGAILRMTRAIAKYEARNEEFGMIKHIRSGLISLPPEYKPHNDIKWDGEFFSLSGHD